MSKLPYEKHHRLAIEFWQAWMESRPQAEMQAWEFCIFQILTHIATLADTPDSPDIWAKIEAVAGHGAALAKVEAEQAEFIRRHIAAE